MQAVTTAETTARRALQIDSEYQNLLPALTAEESAALEASIEAEGCRDALIAWGNTLVDGHNRYEICTRRGFQYSVRQMDFDSREDVIIWICANQNARRNITPEQKAYLLGKRYEAEKKKSAANQYTAFAGGQSGHRQKTRERIAEEIGVGQRTVQRAADYARAVDILAADSPTIKRKILSGEITAPRVKIVEIAAKPEAERKEAVEKMERGELVEVTTKVCVTCGRELPIDRFSTHGPGRRMTMCRQCRVIANATGKREDIREHMATITSVTDSMYDNTVPDYSPDDILDEIRRGAETFRRLINNVLQQHSDLINAAGAKAQYNDLISDISSAIYDLRRK